MAAQDKQLRNTQREAQTMQMQENSTPSDVNSGSTCALDLTVSATCLSDGFSFLIYL